MASAQDRAGTLAVDLNGFVEICKGAIEIAAIGACDASAAICCLALWVQPNSFGEVRYGFLDIPLPKVDAASGHNRFDVLAVNRDGSVEICKGAIEIAGSHVRATSAAVCDRVLGVEPNGFGVMRNGCREIPPQNVSVASALHRLDAIAAQLGGLDEI